MLNYIQDYKEWELWCSYYDISYKTYHIDRCRVWENNLNLVKQWNIYWCLVEKKWWKIDILNTTYCGIAYLWETIFSK